MSASWVQDLDLYNEWMSEEDYEVDEKGGKKVHKLRVSVEDLMPSGNDEKRVVIGGGSGGAGGSGAAAKTAAGKQSKRKRSPSPTPPKGASKRKRLVSHASFKSLSHLNMFNDFVLSLFSAADRRPFFSEPKAVRQTVPMTMRT